MAARPGDNPGMEIPKVSERGGWGRVLVALLLIERAVAWAAFPLDEASHEIAAWERLYWWIWGLLLFGIASFPLAFRRRVGGWLAALSGGFLILRACVPLLGEKPAAGAVVALMVASATLTFAFLYEQSYWPASEERPPSDPPE